MTELEKLIYTKTFIDKLANGINPLDDSIIPDNDLINNIRISRCMFYVSDILRKVCENGGIESKLTKKYRSRNPFVVTKEELQKFEYSDEPIPISVIVRKINDLTDSNVSGRLSLKGLKNWLLSKDYLENKENDRGKTRSFPTEKGEQLGILVELRNGYRGSYYAINYNKEAQEFVINNMEEIMNFVNNDEEESTENEWNNEQNKTLIEMFQDGIVLDDIAKTLSKSVEVVQQRLKEMGYMK